MNSIGLTDNGSSRPWSTSWVATQQIISPRHRPRSPGLTGNSLSVVVPSRVGGDRLRVTLSNQFGDGVLQVLGATVALADCSGRGRIVEASRRAFTFRDRPGTLVPPGEVVVSDPCRFAFDHGPLVIAIHLGRVPELMSGHTGALSESYLQLGKRALSASDASGAVAIDQSYIVSRLDVETETARPAVVVVGDSIADQWSAHAMRREAWSELVQPSGPRGQSVWLKPLLSHGLKGNRVLRDGNGPSLLTRLERDAFDPLGVDTLLVQAGAVDLLQAHHPDGDGSRVDVTDLISAFKRFAASAHRRGVFVMAGTLTPFAGSALATRAAEADRKTFNTWLRATGNLDAVIDFDAAVRDADDPSRLRSEFDSGDHFHPNVRGYQAMCDAVPVAVRRRLIDALGGPASTLARRVLTLGTEQQQPTRPAHSAVV